MTKDFNNNNQINCHQIFVKIQWLKKNYALIILIILVSLEDTLKNPNLQDRVLQDPYKRLIIMKDPSTLIIDHLQIMIINISNTF